MKATGRIFELTRPVIERCGFDSYPTSNESLNLGFHRMANMLTVIGQLSFFCTG